MHKYYSALALLLFVMFQSSCKKDKEALTCRLSTWEVSGQTYYYTYNSQGFVERMSVSNSSSYIVYTQSGNLLTSQAYDSTGTAIGTPAVRQVNADGYYSMIPGSSDTTYLTYNAAGQLLTYVRRNDTIISQSTFTYENGDMVKAISLKSDSSISSIATYDHYTDRVNNTNLNVSIDLLEPRYGKPNRHLLKSSTTSNSSGNIDFNTFYYEFDENGNPVSLQLIRQPGNDISNLKFTYGCE
ncbi:MAG: hypothetical protein IPN22_00720 [Bacteroidetes bacterium]|nr:hypothetical protein [Bacteroidota bacterium]